MEDQVLRGRPVMSGDEVDEMALANWLAGVRNYIASVPGKLLEDPVVQGLAKDVYDVIYDRVFLANPGGMAASVRQQLALYEQRRADQEPSDLDPDMAESVMAAGSESPDA